jgi:hypothetical protein
VLAGVAFESRALHPALPTLGRQLIRRSTQSLGIAFQPSAVSNRATAIAAFRHCLAALQWCARSRRKFLEQGGFAGVASLRTSLRIIRQFGGGIQ